MAAIPYNLSAIAHTAEGKISFGLNALLLQSWVPEAQIWRGFNGPSWYLSTLVFLFLITPFLEYIDTKFDKKKTYVYGVLLLFMIAVCFALPVILKKMLSIGCTHFHHLG